MLCFAFLISTSFTVGRAITSEIEPAALTFLRFLMALGIFAVLVCVSGTKLHRPDARDCARYLWLALLLVTYFVSMFEALRWTSALNAGAVFMLGPLITTIVSYFLLGQRPSTMQLAALCVAAAGAIWIMFDGKLDALLKFSMSKGEVIFLFGVVSYAIYSPSIRKLHGAQNLVELTFWTLVAGTFLLAVYGWREIAETGWSEVPVWVYLGILHLAIFTTAITFYLVQYASIYLPSAKVMAYVYLIPAFVVTQNAVMGQPWPSWPVMAGVGVIIVAMIMLQRAEPVS